MKLCILTALFAFTLQAAGGVPPRPNVLFIAVDDLNHWVGHLGRNPQVKTPNIDRLARKGVTFTRAYCAAPVCNPSRTAIMSGMRPSTTGVYHNPIDYRPHVLPEQTLNSHFRKHGYFVAGAGKIYHGGGGRLDEWDDYMRGGGGEPKGKLDDRSVGGIKFGLLDCADSEMGDYKTASWIIGQLERQHDKPFFLACGFHKPHMPWNVPKKYYDLYPLDTIRLPSVQTNDLADLPPEGVQMARAMGDHAKILESGKWKEAVQGYLAAISFLDAQVGRVIDTLEKSPVATNTIVCFWGDHGWHLGEKEHWRKFALWEEATRAPFVWIVPGLTRPGGVCERTVDFMSIYPTLCELTGAPVPKHVEGASIRKLLANPNAPWNIRALTTHGFQNHAVRSEKWRYIRYAEGGEELYDHDKDPYEWSNLAGKPELASVKDQLANVLPKNNAPEPKPRTARQQRRERAAPDSSSQD
jgi:arylsulfatase A-like enzyme